MADENNNASTGQAPQRIMERSFVWFVLGVIVAAVIGTVSVLGWLETYVEGKIADAGTIGATGDTGPAGPKGPKGDTGPAGASVTAKDVATFLLANHEDDIRGPRGEPGESGTGAPIPDGLVIASLKRCGDLGAGWETYDGAAGRVIVGFGETTIAGTTRKFLFEETDGYWEHQLTIPEMPTHNHSVNDPKHDHGHHGLAQTDNSAPSHGWAGIKGRYSNTAGRSIGTGISIADAGQGKPHNNMPPYIALYFCKKEAG